MITIEQALRIAIDAHEGQKDLDGKPVILHPLTVGLAGKNREEMIAGFLHDVVEDTDITFGNLLEQGVDKDIVDVLRLLSHNKETDYYDYLKNHQKGPWWSAITKWFGGIVKSIMPKKTTTLMGGDGKKDPYWLSQDDEGLAESVRGNISFSIDKQTFVISISTRAQDPFIAKILADSVQAHLQQFVTDYRTNKARIDEKYYQQLLEEATLAYKQSCDDYAQKTDANSNIVLNKFKVEQENMEKDMQLKYTTLQSIATQLQMASAKVQERTPAFTVIKGASVAQKPAGPKRMFFVLGMLMLVTVAYVFWILRTDLKNILLNNE